ncbi:MAG: L-histidine N(alpha)-methyltransferase, partial [Bacteroidia bacterium]
YISPKYFYNAGGSQLFESITELEEYYPTRTEKAILSGIGNRLKLDFNDLNIVELGSGDPSKIRLLLQQIPSETLATIHYYPVDISHTALEGSAMQLTEEFPEMAVTGIVADFMKQFDKLPKTQNRLFCFLGSTIGNFNPEERLSFMQHLGNEMEAGDHLLLGLDMVKDPRVLHRAYNDGQQVTAAFNKNILNVVNGIIDTSFDSADFEHLAFYNENEQRIEMHLKAMKDRKIRINGNGETLDIKKGETIHTENSYKFNREDIESIGSHAGLEVASVFTDEKLWFSLVHYYK